eukprot:266448_1
MATVLTTEDYQNTYVCHMQSIDSILLAVNTSLTDTHIQNILSPKIRAECLTFFTTFRNELSTKTSTHFLFELTNNHSDSDSDSNDNNNINNNNDKEDDCDMNRIKKQLHIMDTGKDILHQIIKASTIIDSTFKNISQSLNNNLITLDIAFARFIVLSKFISLYFINICEINTIHSSNNQNTNNNNNNIPEHMIENLNNIHRNKIYE